jgi:hypothetical protein
MANQEYPMFALERAASLIGNAMMPQVGRSDLNARRASTSVPATTGGGNLLDRLDTWFWRQRQRADEAYLAQSQDVFDLERRIRTLERSVGSRYY